MLPNLQPNFSILKERRGGREFIQRKISLVRAIPVAVVTIVLQKRLDLLVKFAFDTFRCFLVSEGNSSRQAES